MGGLLLTFASLIALQFESTRYFAPGIYLAGAISDFLDGRIARMYGLQTKEGARLDPLMDKIKNLAIGGFMILREQFIFLTVANFLNFAVDFISQRQRGPLRHQFKEAWRAVLHPETCTIDTNGNSNIRANVFGKAKLVVQNIAQGLYITFIAYHEIISSLIDASEDDLQLIVNVVCIALFAASAILGSISFIARMRK